MSWPPERRFSPHRWQAEAVDAWMRNGGRGIIEAVTGTGKTFAGIEAIDRLIRSEARLATIIVVPTGVLMDQWRTRLMHAWQPSQKVSRVSQDYKEDFSTMPIACVMVINSALTTIPRVLEHVGRHPGRWKTLLIADECHRYVDAPEWGRLPTLWHFNYVLGLSATMQRYEVPGFGRIAYEYTFQQAFADDLIPPFDLVNAEVELSPTERERYLELSESISEQLNRVRHLYEHELARASDDRFFQKLREIMMRGADKPDEYEPNIKKLFILMFKRAAIAYMAKEKLALAEQIVRLLTVDHARKAMVFFERIESAESLGEAVVEDSLSMVRGALENPERGKGRSGVPCRLYNSAMTPSARKAALAAFQASGPSALLACRALDEGLDIPAVDAALLVSSTQSARQRTQRIGRTLRRGQGKKRSLIISLHVRGTTDMDVTGEDASTFGKVAEIHRAYGPESLDLIRRLLGSSDGRGSSGRPVSPPPSDTPRLPRLRPTIHLPPMG